MTTCNNLLELHCGISSVQFLLVLETVDALQYKDSCFGDKIFNIMNKFKGGSTSINPLLSRVQFAKSLNLLKQHMCLNLYLQLYYSSSGKNSIDKIIRNKNSICARHIVVLKTSFKQRPGTVNKLPDVLSVDPDRVAVEQESIV